METRKKPLLSPLLLWFMGTMILANIAAQMIFPLESLYVQELGASVEQVGLFFTIAAIAPLVFQVFGGWLSDAVGRLQAIAIGSAGGAVAFLFYILAPSWIWLLPSSILTAMAIAFVAPSFQAFIAEESTSEMRGRVYGITSTMYMVVNIVGPILGGAIAQGLTFRTLYIVAGSLYTTAAVIRVMMARHASRRQKESGKPAEAPSFAGFRKSVLAVFGLMAAGGVVTWIFISDGVRDVAFSLVDRLMPLYLENEMGLHLLQIGALQSITAIVAMALMSPAGWLSDKKGERVGIVGGFGLISIGWLTFLVGSNFWHFVISRIVVGAGWALIDPAYSSLISKAVPNKLRGTAFGLFSTSLGLISLPAPWIGARLWDAVNPIFPFYIPLIAMVVILPVMWVKFKLPADAADTAGGVPPSTIEPVTDLEGGEFVP
jgi:DHA1 family multidrug resistance protein-like MFS transporter